MMPRHGARVACALLAMAICPWLRAAEPAVSPERQAVLDARMHKADEARAGGFWVVAPGEHLRLIARQFFPGDRPRQRRLREAIVAANPGAFVHGDRDRLISGTRLAIPRDALERDATRGSGASAESKASARTPAPPSSPAAIAPVTVPAPEFAPEPRARPPPPRAPAYVDQLIEGAASETAGSATAVEEAAMQPGERYTSAEYRLEGRAPPGGGHGIEQGVEAHMRRETLNYGDFHLEAAIRDTRSASNDVTVSRRDGGRFTLYQDRFPLVRDWLADSAFGVVRTPPNFLNTSYRIFLPTSIMAGATSVISDGSRSITAYGGHIGRLEGTAVQSFDPTTGNLAGLGYAQRAGAWTLGGEAIALRGSAQVPDHDAATLAAEYGGFGSPVHDKLQAVADDHSHAGAWFDGDLLWGPVRHRFGLYQLDPGLQWGDTALTNDQRGAYWRGDYRLLRHSVSGGVDLLQTNFREDPARPANRSASAYGTFSLRIDRDLNVGGGLTVQENRMRFAASPRGSTVSGNAYASWSTPLGLSRFDATGYRATATGVPDNTIESVSWSQEWPAGAVRVSSTLTYAHESQLGERTTRTSAGLSARGTLLSDVLWDTSLVYGRVARALGAENDFNVAANVSWPLAPHWFALAQLSVNTFEALPLLPGAEPSATQHDKRLLLGVRYEESSGTPYQTLGLRAGPGSGRLTGVVFFDDNGDGMRQPTERGAPNVTLYLDGRYPVTTDAQGRFSFGAVAAGAHSLRILNEALPLPWTADDEHPPTANVPLRGDVVLDIPLTKIRP